MEGRYKYLTLARAFTKGPVGNTCFGSYFRLAFRYCRTLSTQRWMENLVPRAFRGWWMDRINHYTSHEHHQNQFLAFTWRHGRHVGVPKHKNRGYVGVPTNPYRIELNYYANVFLLFRLKDMAVDQMSKNQALSHSRFQIPHFFWRHEEGESEWQRERQNAIGLIPHDVKFFCWVTTINTRNRGGSRIFLRRGCATKEWRSWLVTSFFWRIPVVLESRRSSQGSAHLTTWYVSYAMLVRLKKPKQLSVAINWSGANGCAHAWCVGHTGLVLACVTLLLLLFPIQLVFCTPCTLPLDPPPRMHCFSSHSTKE